MKKRILALCLIGTMLVVETGCGAESDGAAGTGTGSEPAGQETAADDTLDVKEQGEVVQDAGEQTDVQLEEAQIEDTGVEDEEDAAQTATVPEVNIEKRLPDEGADTSAIDFVENMKVGWVLGNTFDAYTDENMADEMSYESYWCGIETTKEMIDAVKAAGFETLRIPVSWHNHVSDDGNYTISEAWLDRVQEVVDYAMDNDMYVILNIHHDNSTKYMYPSQEYAEQSKTYIRAIWTQLAQRFADYDEHLIMESLNEPRLTGTSYEWWLDFNSQECVDAVKYINEYNQVFVDTVRASGGYNAERYLLVPGYDASLQGATNEYFELPKDAEGNVNKILVEVHAYTPYNFALQAPGESGSTDQWSMNSPASTSEINNLMDTLFEQYVKNGTGVVIDEFGARDKGGNIQARIDFISYYIAAARARNITCCLWDNNSFSGTGENFGIFQRRECSFLYPELVEGMMKYSE